jgi:hypothetical protein
MKNVLVKFICLTILIIGNLISYKAQAQNPLASNRVMVSTNDSLGFAYKTQIVNWLKSLIKPVTPVRNNMVDQILKNAEFDKMYAEYKDMDRKVLVIPLKKSYFSQHISKSSPMPFQNLFFTIGKNGKLSEDGYIMLIKPRDKSLKELPENTFRNYCLQYQALDGTYTMIGIFLADCIIGEMDIKGGERVRVQMWTHKKADNTSDNSHEWVLKTDILENGSVVKTTTQSLGISNTVSPPQFKADKRTEIVQ